MAKFKRGDRVRARRWGDQFVGTVRDVDADGDLYVRRDGIVAEDQMHPDEVEPVE